MTAVAPALYLNPWFSVGTKGLERKDFSGGPSLTEQE